MKRQSLSIALLFALITLLYGCANHRLVHVSGVKRVEINQQGYELPQFYVMNFNPKASNRKIARLDYTHSTEGLSVKKLYFLTLWQQQIVFNKILGKDTQLTSYSCPQFHNDLISFHERLDTFKHAFKHALDGTQEVKSVKDVPSEIVFHPVLTLPYKGVDLYSYLDQSKQWEKSNQHVRKALDLYAYENEKEIANLCSLGVTDGLYIFQNMATYYSDDNNFVTSQEALTSILKIKPISNMLILNSFAKLEHQDHLSFVQKEFLQRLNVSWFKNYLYEVTSMRKNKLNSFALKE